MLKSVTEEENTDKEQTLFELIISANFYLFLPRD